MLAGRSPQTTSAESGGSEATASIPEGYMCQYDWLGTPPEVSDIVETIECEIVVVGGGHAGTHAALAAAEGGANVHVIEKDPRDTHGWTGNDVGSFNSKFIKEKSGYGDYDIGEIVTEYLVRGAGHANYEVIRKYVANSGEAVDNMVSYIKWPDDRIRINAKTADPSKGPIDDDQIIIHIPHEENGERAPMPVTCGGYKSWVGALGFYGPEHAETTECTPTGRLDEAEQFCMLASEDQGAVWHFEESAVKLVQDDSGAVTGVITESADGFKEYRASKGVILCSGDYGANPDMLWNLNTEMAEFAMRSGYSKEDIVGVTRNTGDGHKMGCWAGGQIEPGPRAVMNFSNGGGGPWATAPFLWVNENGKRFMNEGAQFQAVVQQQYQPAGKICTITDANYLQSIYAHSCDHTMPVEWRPVWFEYLAEDMAKVPLGSTEGYPVRGIEIVFHFPYTVYGAETLDELADIIGYEGEAKQQLLDTIERYNELCHKGVDSDFGKDAKAMIPIEKPPFYAHVSQNDGFVNSLHVTLGGLVTSGDLQVLDKEGNPIPGLYAAGNVVGCRYGVSYGTPVAGSSIGMAVTHGRVVGKMLTGQEIA